MSAIVDSNSSLAWWTIDVLIERYVAWREQCSEVRQAYRRWSDSDRDERTLTYAGYVATLDAEEHAAHAYAEQIERVIRTCV